jgi:Tfp pilus assembly protein PilF
VSRAAVAALLAALVAPAASADEGMAFATLGNGASIGFALLRTGSGAPSGAIGEAVLPRSNSVSRVLWDRSSGAYFGYRVEVDRRDGPRPFRIVFKPLDHGAVERALRERGGCPGCPPPSPLGARPQFPAAQQLAEGDALTLELLANPTTGERILDVVRLSASPLSEEAMRSAASRALEGQQAVTRAGALVARGRYAPAAEEFRRALEVQPNDATVHNQLGICYQRLSNVAMARREYERALELRPGYAEVWNNIGTLEQSHRRFKPAVRAYKKAIELKPSLATPWKNLGNAYLALGQPQEAFEAYQEAFRLDPTILEEQAAAIPAAGVEAADQHLLIAKLLAARGKTEAALDYLARARAAGFRDFRRVERDPDFRVVVADPRYRELVDGK